MTSFANNIPIQKHFWTLNVYLSTDFHNFAAHFKTKGMLNQDQIFICMRVFHNVVIHAKPPSNRCRIRSSHSLI